MSIRVLSEPFKKTLLSLGSARIAVPISDIPEGLAESLGFSPVVEGISSIPAIVGKYSEFNANGRLIARTDLPKEMRHFQMYGTHRDWGGGIHQNLQTRSRMVYQRELVPPPNEYLTVAKGPNGLWITSRSFLYDETAAAESDDAVVHLINLFLELFQKFDFVGNDLVAPAAKVVKVNWKVLPVGKYPFKRVMSELTGLVNLLEDNERPVIEYRLKAISEFSPDFMAVGSGGFADYVVLGFTKTGLFILESPKLGNATYAFLDGWEQFSQLTKRDILTGAHNHARIVHNKKWPEAIRKLITNPR